MATFNLQSGFYSVALQGIENPHLLVSASNPSMQSLHAGDMAYVHMYSYYSETQAVLIPSCYTILQHVF